MKALSCALYLLFCTCFVYAQHQRFEAGVVAGLNFAELTGTDITDYFGLNAGLIGTAKITQHLQFGMEMLFSQNGEYLLPDYYPDIQYGTIRLNHLEIPLHLDLLIGVFEREDYYDWNINIGVAYTRLLSYYAEDQYGLEVTDQVVYSYNDEYLLQAGTTYRFSDHLGVNFKASLPIRVEGLSWSLAGRLVYWL